MIRRCWRRRADQAALLATLLFARGTPMLSMGAEMGQSQQGNNNAYCQDGPLSWLDWGAADAALLGDAARLVRARLAHPALGADHFLTGQPQDQPDAAWFHPDGRAMTAEDWRAADTLVAVFAAGGDRVAIAINRARTAQPLALPPARAGNRWTLAYGEADGVLAARSVSLFAEQPATG